MERAHAIVVRGTDWSETSRIVTLFTREFGKIRALAKGGRRLKSSFETALDLLTVCEIVFIRKSHGGLDLLTEAIVSERFPAMRTDLKTLYAGYYVAELLSDGTQDYDPHPELYDSACEVLRDLSKLVSPSKSEPSEASQIPEKLAAPTVGPRGDMISRFELVWLRELGYTPRLDACASCGTAGPLPLPSGRILIGPEAGGVICPSCRLKVRDARSLSPDAFAAFANLVNGAPRIPDDVRHELRPLLGQMVCHTLGRRPKLMTYLDGG